MGDHCSDGRCGGLYLPVDAHPKLMLRPDGNVWRPRVQSFDAPFGLEATDKVCLHQNSNEKCYKSKKARPTFNDLRNFWVPPDPSVGNFGWASVPVPHTGTAIQVLSQNGGRMQVGIRFNQP